MTKKMPAIQVLCAAFLFAVVTLPAKANVTLSYTGNLFTGFQQFGTLPSGYPAYTTSNRLTFSLTLADVLGANLVDETVVPLSFTASDGLWAYSSAPANYGDFHFWTNGVGDVVGWEISVGFNNAGTPGISGNIQSYNSDFDVSDYAHTVYFETCSMLDWGGVQCSGDNSVTNGWNEIVPSTWAYEQVPEPGTLALLGIAGLALATLRRPRRNAYRV